MGQATLEGQGIALTDVNPLSADPAADRLVRLFECSMETQEGDYITYPPGALRRPKVKALRDVLIEESLAEKREQTA